MFLSNKVLWSVCRLGFSIVQLTIVVGIHQVEAAQSETQENQSTSKTTTLERLKALRQQAHDLVSENRVAEGGAILQEVTSLEEKESLPHNRDVGRAFVDIASTLKPTGDYVRLENIFLRGIQILQASSNMKLGDLMVALHNLGVLYDERKEYQARDRVMASIVNQAEIYEGPMDQDSAMVFLSLGKMYERADHPKAVAILYGQVHRYLQQQQLPLDALWLARYAKSLFDDSQYDEALDLYGQALKVEESRNPPNYERLLVILMSMGNVALRKKDFLVAEQILDRARHIAAESGLTESTPASVVYHNLASLYMTQRMRHKYPDAIKLFEHSLRIKEGMGNKESNEYAMGLKDLAKLMELMVEFEKANEHYKAAIRIFESAKDTRDQDFATCLSDFGFFLLKQDKPAEAITAFERALQLHESNPRGSPDKHADALSNVATAHFKLGHFEQASQLYWRAISLRTPIIAQE